MKAVAAYAGVLSVIVALDKKAPMMSRQTPMPIAPNIISFRLPERSTRNSAASAAAKYSVPSHQDINRESAGVKPSESSKTVVA